MRQLLRSTLVLLAAAAPIAAAAAGAASAVASPVPFGLAGSGYPFDQNSAPGPATLAAGPTLGAPVDVAPLADGGFLIADVGDGRVLRVDRAGQIRLVYDPSTPGHGPLGDATGLAVAADGSWIVASSASKRVYSLSPAGVATPLAGSGHAGDGGDGGPALAASLRLQPPSIKDFKPILIGLLPLPGGGFLLSDTGNHRVRRVAPGGTITTVAGTGTAGSAGDGGAATAAQLDRPEGLAALPGGGFVVADSVAGRVRSVSPAGAISTLASGLAKPRGVAVLADGTVLVSLDGGGLDRLAAGTATPFATPSSDENGRAYLTEPVGMKSLPDGGVLVADQHASRVDYLAPASPGVLAVALRAFRARAGSIAGTVELTRPASLTLTLHDAAHRGALATEHLSAPAGTSTFALTGKFPLAGVDLQVLASDPTGAGASDASTELLLADRLPAKLAAKALDAACCSEGDEGESFGVTHCTAFGKHRFDCQVDAFTRDFRRGHPTTTTVTCKMLTTVALGPGGGLTGHDYRCPHAHLRFKHAHCKTTHGRRRCTRIRPYRRPLKHPHYVEDAHRLRL